MKVGICGLGQMGAGIAACFAEAGHDVVAWDVRPDASACIATAKGADKLEVRIDREYGNADVVVECVTEDLETKARVLREARHGALMLTTTSGLSITAMGGMLPNGGRLVGAHFWNPPQLMPLVEVVRGQATCDDAFEGACRLIEGLGKQTVKVERDVPGFIGNRLLHAMWREAIELVASGVAAAHDIDRVAKLTFGLRAPVLGPLENVDVVGAALVQTIHDYLYGSASPLLKDMAAAGTTFYGNGRQEAMKRRDVQIVSQLDRLREWSLL